MEAIEVITLLAGIPAEITDTSPKMEITEEITEMIENTEMKRNQEHTTAPGQNRNTKKLEMIRKNKKRNRMEPKKMHTKR